MVLFWCVL